MSSQVHTTRLQGITIYIVDLFRLPRGNFEGLGLHRTEQHFH